MTGTASETYDYNDDFNPSLSNTQLFSAWLFGKINADCLLSDITQCGCSILVPKKCTSISDNFNLIIMSPANSEKILTILTAEKCWNDENYSATHQKIGIKFSDVKGSLLEEVNTLIEYFTSHPNPQVKCSTLNR